MLKFDAAIGSMATARSRRKPVRVELGDAYQSAGGDTERGGGETERQRREEGKLEQLKQFMEGRVDALDRVDARKSAGSAHEQEDEREDLNNSCIIFDRKKGVFRGVSDLE